MNTKFTVRKEVQAGPVKSASTDTRPQAYIFLGRQGLNGVDGPTMRRRFLAFAEMFLDANGNKVSQNTFGLTIVQDWLDDFEKMARKDVGDAAFKKSYAEALAIVNENDKTEAARKAARDAAAKKEAAKK